MTDEEIDGIAQALAAMIKVEIARKIKSGSPIDIEIKPRPPRTEGSYVLRFDGRDMIYIEDEIVPVN